jgi:hypothetical protein
MTLEISERDDEARQRFIKQMDKYLTRPDDRALFDLPETQKQTTPSTEKKEKVEQPEKTNSNQRK